MIKKINSMENNWVKMTASLLTKKGRFRANKMIIEGVKLVAEAKEFNDIIEEYIVCPPLFTEASMRFYSEINNSESNIVEVTMEIFKKITDTKTPQGIAAVVKMPRHTIDSLNDKDFILIADGVQDPGNLGTLIRTSEAFGVDAVILLQGTVDYTNPKVVRSTMGSIYRMKIIDGLSNLEIVDYLSRKGYSLIVSSPKGENDIRDLDIQPPVAVVVGNESKGVSDYLINKSNTIVRIPISRKVESLNVSVATGIILYQIFNKIV